MYRKGFLLIFLVSFTLHSAVHPKNFCLKRCFYQCKAKNQAVKDCSISNVSMVGFELNCRCRSLNKGETLPVNPPTYLIKNRVA